MIMNTPFFLQPVCVLPLCSLLAQANVLSEDTVRSNKDVFSLCLTLPSTRAEITASSTWSVVFNQEMWGWTKSWVTHPSWAVQSLVFQELEQRSSQKYNPVSSCSHPCVQVEPEHPCWSGPGGSCPLLCCLPCSGTLWRRLSLPREPGMVGEGGGQFAAAAAGQFGGCVCPGGALGPPQLCASTVEQC